MLKAYGQFCLLHTAGYLSIIQQMKELIKGAGKKSYTLVMGRPNSAKLANFPEVVIPHKLQVSSVKLFRLNYLIMYPGPVWCFCLCLLCPNRIAGQQRIFSSNHHSFWSCISFWQVSWHALSQTAMHSLPFVDKEMYSFIFVIIFKLILYFKMIKYG